MQCRALCSAPESRLPGLGPQRGAGRGKRLGDPSWPSAPHGRATCGLFCVLAMGANRLWESPGPGTGRGHFLAGPGGHGTLPESLGVRGRGPHDT